MRRAVYANPGKGAVASTASIAAPVGGWNTEDALAAMPKTDAVILDNWIPRGGQIELRRGFVDHVTGTASPVETLITYGGDPTGDKIFACAGADIFDVSTSGGLPSASYASAANARWNWINFANDAGRYALMVNGANTPMKYDGSTFSTSAVTGTSGSITLTDEDLKFVMAHKRRVHFGEKERLRVWVLAVTAIAGASSLLDLGPYFGKGGVFVGMATWSTDAGAGGMDDLAVYVTSEGQVAVFQGDDPTDSNNWALVGVYDIPRPVGDRPLVRNGSDLCVLTEAGVLPLSAMTLKEEDRRKAMLSRKIASAFASAALDYGANNGWEMTLYPGRGSLLIVNVPTVEDAEAVQYVRSMQNGAWCRFTGIDATCWGQANGAIYLGGELGVYQWDTGASDNSDPIVADVLPAFQEFGARTRTKQFTMVRALMRAPSIVRPALQVVTDYDKNTVPTAVQTVITPGDISPDDATLIRQDWTGAAGNGYVASPRMRVSLIGSDDVDEVAVTSDGSELLLVGPGGTDNILTRPNLPLDVSVECVGFDLVYQLGGIL